MRNRHHVLFRPADPFEDSCIAAAHLANERYLQREAAQEEGKLTSADAGQKERAPYEASDDDLPRIFWEPSDEGKACDRG